MVCQKRFPRGEPELGKGPVEQLEMPGIHCPFREWRPWKPTAQQPPRGAGKGTSMEVRAELWPQELLPSEATVATVAGAHGKAECPRS